MTSNSTNDELISFVDSKVKTICVQNWDKNGDGELSKEEAAAIKNLNQKFRNKGITRFDELQYFTGLTAIETWAFASNTSLSSIILPAGIKSIGENAFYNCKAIKTLNLPAALESIGGSAFAGTGMYEITIDSSNTHFTIYKNMLFTNDLKRVVFCPPLTEGSLTLPNNTQSIAENAFYLCDRLTKLNLNEGLKTIEAGAFQGCTVLGTITIPSTVTSIGEACFHYTHFKQILVADGNQNYTSLYGVLYSKDEKTLICFPAGKSVYYYNVPQGVTVIDKYAFSCSTLSEITLPATVTNIKDYAFGLCADLEKLTVMSATPCSIASTAFTQANANMTLYVPKGSKSKYANADVWKNITNIVEYELGVEINNTNFPDDVFREYVGGETIDKDLNGYLNEDEISAVTTIDVNNLEIRNLQGIEFFTALTTLSCRFTKLNSIDLSQNTALVDLDCRNNSFTTLDLSQNTALVNLKCARNWMTSLDVSKNTKLNLLRCNYNRLTTLDVSNCTNLQRLDCYGNKISKAAMGNLVASLPSGTSGRFYVIDTTLETEENVCTIDQVNAAKAKGWTVYDYHDGSSVEYAGSSEEEIIIFANANVKTICVANWDTNGDGELSKAEAAAVTSLGYTFLGNQEITIFDELQYFTGLTEIGTSAFAYCYNLSGITIPQTVTSIGNQAFQCCFSLSSIIIPNSVITIGNIAFDQCTNLSSVTIPNSVTTIGQQAFSSCSNLSSVIIPNSVTTIGSGAFMYSNLSSVTIPNSVTTIERSTFFMCSNLSSVIIPNSITSIGDYAFGGCIGLTSITIPNSVTDFGIAVFSLCSNLISIDVEEGSNALVSENGVLFNWNKTMLFCYPAGKTETSYVIPNSVAGIVGNAFGGCSRLNSVTIGSNMREIGSYAFVGCTGLKDVYCFVKSNDINYLNFGYYQNVFYDIEGVTLHVPVGYKTYYEQASLWQDFTIVEMEETSIFDVNRETITDNHYYTLSGQQLQGKPTQKGVYIVNGRKIVIK